MDILLAALVLHMTLEPTWAVRLDYKIEDCAKDWGKFFHYREYCLLGQGEFKRTDCAVVDPVYKIACKADKYDWYCIKIVTREIVDPCRRDDIELINARKVYDLHRALPYCQPGRKLLSGEAICLINTHCFIGRGNQTVFIKDCKYKRCPKNVYRGDCPLYGNYLPCAGKEHLCKNNGTCVNVDERQWKCDCSPGFDPTDNCESRCSPNRWGKHCKEECGVCVDHEHKHESCAAVTGACPNKCATGTGPHPRCNKIDCKKTACRNNGKCHQKKCRCTPRYSGKLCEIRLDQSAFNKKYELCRTLHVPVLRKIDIPQAECDDSAICYQERGKPETAFCDCTLVFRQGKHCNESCNAGSDNCLHGKCIKEYAKLDTKRVTGKRCFCRPGWTGDFCRRICSAGTYGIGCNGTCGKCLVSSPPCDVETGECYNGKCINDTYQPPFCNATKSSNDVEELYEKILEGRFKVIAIKQGTPRTFDQDELNLLRRELNGHVFLSLPKATRLSALVETILSPFRKNPIKRDIKGLDKTTLIERARQDVMEEMLRKERQTEVETGLNVDFTVSMVTTVTPPPNLRTKLTKSLQTKSFKSDVIPEIKIDQASISVTQVERTTVSPPGHIQAGEFSTPLLIVISGGAVVLVVLVLAFVVLCRRKPKRRIRRRPRSA